MDSATKTTRQVADMRELEQRARALAGDEERRRLREPRGETVFAPEFDRDIEESIAGAIAVESGVGLVVTEGNYLLSDSGPWREIRALLDEVWYCEVPDDIRIDRLVARRVGHGAPAEDARRCALGSDQRNAEVVAATRSRADLVVRLPRAGPCDP
jgi:pantothenate kinase